MRKVCQFKKIVRFVIVCILIASVILINLHFYNAFKKQTLQSNAYAKQQVIEGISDYYTQVDVLVDALLMDDDFKKLESLETKKEAYQSGHSSEVISLIKLLNDLPDAIDYIYIYLEKLDLIISSDGIIGRDVFYDVMGKQYTSSIEKWDEIAVIPEEKIGFKMVGDWSVFTLKQHFENTNPYTLGVIANLDDIFIDNNYAEWISSSNVYIFDRYGALSLMNEKLDVLSLGNIPDRRMLFELSEEYDLVSQTVAVNDKKYDVFFLFEKGLDMMLVEQLQMMLFAAMVVSCAVLSYFVYLQVVEKYRPFKELAELLKINVTEPDIKSLHSPIKNIINNNSELSRLIEDKNSMLNKLIFEKLLSGNLNGSSNEELSRLGLHFQYDGYVVAVLYFYEDTDATAELKQEIESEAIRKINKKFEEKECTVSLVSMKEYLVCILNSDADNFKEDELIGTFETIIEVLDTKYETVVSAVISNVCTELWQISLAYSDVLKVIRKSELYRESRVIVYTDAERNEILSEFDVNREKELMFALKKGDYAAAEEIIRWYTSSDKENDARSYNNKSLDLIYSLIRILGGDVKSRQNMQNIFMALKNIEDRELVRTMCCNLVKRICMEATEAAQEENLVGQIISMIHEKYGDPQLCLEFICDALGYSGVHLNNLFKEEKNMTIVTYLSNYRIEKAKEFILEGKPIKEVVEMVGITNARTFNRLFLSITNMTPTEYRNENKKTLDNV